MRFSARSALAVTACALMLTACGGGGSGDGTGEGGSSAISLSGTAAVGAPLPSAVVVLRDAKGSTLTVTADVNGAFTFADVSGVIAPFMLQATGTAGGTTHNLYSIATSATPVLNVTPATDAITAQTLGEDPSTAFTSTAKIGAADPAKLAAAKTRLVTALAEVYEALGLSADQVDLMATAFTANNTGMDKLLDVVGFQVQVQSDKPVVLLTNKIAGLGVAIDPDASSPTPLPVPSASDLSLDIAGINTLIGGFNTQMASTSTIASAAMLDLFTTDFLEEGMNRTEMVADLAGYAGAKYTSFVLQTCEASSSTCNVLMGYRDPDGTEGADPMVVRRGSDGKWRFYGDQSPFGYSINTVSFARFHVSDGASSTRAGLQSGVNLNIDSNVAGLTTPSATLEFSVDGGSTWNAIPVARFTSDKCPGNPYLSIDNGTADCGNFLQIVEAKAIQLNASMLEGKLFTRVRLYGSADYTGLRETHVSKVTARLLIDSTALQALSRSGIAVTALEDGYRSISFTGIGLEYLRVDVPVGPSTMGAEWQGGVNLLGGKVTMADAIAKCSEHVEASTCSSQMGGSARFSSMMLVARTPQNQSVWAFHALPGFYP